MWIWSVFFAFLFPEIFTFTRSLRMCLFKSPTKSSISDALIVVGFETMHIVGLGLLIFLVLPNLDVIKGAMLTNCVAQVPGILGLLSRHSRESHRALKMVFDIGAVLCQVTGFIIWPLNETWNGNYILWTIPVAVLLTSCGWWENYVDRRAPVGFVKRLGKVKERLKKSRYFVYSFTPLVKIFAFFVTMLFCLWLNGAPVMHIFTHFFSGYQSHGINITQVEHAGTIRTDQHFLKDTIEVRSENTIPIYATLIQIIGVYLAYIFGKFACKICIQGFSFAFPVMLSVPVTVVVLITACGLRSENPCWMKGYLPDYLYFECPNAADDFLADFISNQVSVHIPFT